MQVLIFAITVISGVEMMMSRLGWKLKAKPVIVGFTLILTILDIVDLAWSIVASQNSKKIRKKKIS